MLLVSMWDRPRPELEPMSSALAGGFFTTDRPGKPLPKSFLQYGAKTWCLDMVCTRQRTRVRGPLLPALRHDSILPRHTALPAHPELAVKTEESGLFLEPSPKHPPGLRDSPHVQELTPSATTTSLDVPITLSSSAKLFFAVLRHFCFLKNHQQSR